MPGTFRAIGFSQKAGSPARAAAAMSPACAEVAEAITTASTPGRSASATVAAARRAGQGRDLGGPRRVGVRDHQLLDPGWRARIPAWKAPIRPVPITPIRMATPWPGRIALSRLCPDNRTSRLPVNISGALRSPRAQAAQTRGGLPEPLQLSVDRTSPVPLYFQLSQQLEAAIEKGTLTPGSLLGNEIDLAQRLGLSRPTVRQAIQALVDKGLLVRRREWAPRSCTARSSARWN